MFLHSTFVIPRYHIQCVIEFCMYIVLFSHYEFSPIKHFRVIGISRYLLQKFDLQKSARCVHCPRYANISSPVSGEHRPSTSSHGINNNQSYNTRGSWSSSTRVTVSVSCWLEHVSCPNLSRRWIVAMTTIWSGLSYIFSKDAVRILSETRKYRDPPSS